MTPATIKTVADAVFAELELLVATRPLLSLAVSALQQLVDAKLVAKVATSVNGPATPSANG